MTKKLTALPLFETSEDGAGEISLNDGGDGQLKPKEFVEMLDRHKALIFRRDGSQAALSTEDFGDFVMSLQLERYPYVGGAAPRTIIPVKASPDDGIVFTANERYAVLSRALMSLG